MSSISDSSASFPQDPCRQLAGTIECLSLDLKKAHLDPDQQIHVNAELLAIYRELSNLANRVAELRTEARAYEEESIGEEWPIIDPRGYQMVNSPIATAWISNLLSTVSLGLVSGGAKGRPEIDSLPGNPNSGAGPNSGTETSRPG